MLRLFANANYDFIGLRRYAYGVTAAVILPGLLFLLIKGLNYSIEFTGGTLLQVRSKAAVDVAKLRTDLDREGIHGAICRRNRGSSSAGDGRDGPGRRPRPA